MKEYRESYQELEEKLNSMGSIKDIVKSCDLIKKILTYAGDRNLTALFFQKINNAVKIGELNDDDLEILRSNWIVSQIINLDKLVKVTGRGLYTHELGDKINYFSLLKDDLALINFYTNPRLINSIIQNSNSELNYWFSRGLYNLPNNVKLAIAKSFINKNQKAKAIAIIDLINERNQKEQEIIEEEKIRHGF